MSDFRKFREIERLLMKTFVFFINPKMKLFGVLSFFSVVPFYIFGVFDGKYLFSNETNLFFEANMIGIHIALLQYITMYAVRLTQEAISYMLDFLTTKMAYQNYRSVIKNYGVEHLNHTNP